MHEKSAGTAQALRDMAKEGELRLKVHGGCMFPLLESGAIVNVRAAGFYWPGDCLVFAAADGRLTAHRLIGYYFKQRQIRCLTQADHAHRPDASIHHHHIIGKVCGGACDPRLINVPFRHRLRAIGRFCRFVRVKSGVPYPRFP